MGSGAEIIKQVGAMSYFGIFGLSFIANIVVPVPEEIVLLAIGYVAGMGTINFWIALPVVVAGSLISDMGMFALSRNDNRFVTGFYTKFFAKIFPINQEFLKAHSEKVIFFSRFLVQLRFLGPFIAGQSRATWKRFIAYDLLALLVYVPVLMWAGHYFAKSIDQIFDGVNTAKNIVIVVTVLVALWGIGKFIKNLFIAKYAKDASRRAQSLLDKKPFL